ncbi:hypothetical protein [Nocardia sp. NBC_01327]|nr:hypothetical protein OG326_28100 [Nocardia sp. NBC_01327]
MASSRSTQGGIAHIVQVDIVHLRCDESGSPFMLTVTERPAVAPP